MGNRVLVSADCVCDLPKDLVEKYSISIIPFYVKINGVRFQEGTEVDGRVIREKMKKNETKIVSMPASVEEYREYFSRISNGGEKTVLHISIAGKMSNAYDNAVKAAQDMPNIQVVNSELISLGMGLFALAAAKLAMDEKATPERIVGELEKIRKNINCSFVMRTTKYAADNDKLSQMLATLLDLFRIKPIIRIKNGVFKVRGFCVGGNRSYIRKYIRKTLRNRKNISQQVLTIVHSGGLEEFRDVITKEISTGMNWENVYVKDLSVASLCSIGLGSFGLTFYGNKYK